jgi:hypothetical protein
VLLDKGDLHYAKSAFNFTEILANRLNELFKSLDGQSQRIPNYFFELAKFDHEEDLRVIAVNNMPKQVLTEQAI